MEALAEAVDFSAVAPVILGVGGALMALFVIIRAVQIAVGFIRGSGDAGGAARIAAQDTPGNAERSDHDFAHIFEEEN